MFMKTTEKQIIIQTGTLEHNNYTANIQTTYTLNLYINRIYT